jgi:hypothetical protein
MKSLDSKLIDAVQGADWNIDLKVCGSWSLYRMEARP